ncbi:MAG: hypothetical protein ACO3OK_14705, partial [Limisphaerales bacterium]
LRQMGLGLQLYVGDYDGYFPKHSSLKSETTALGKPRRRWADELFPYMTTESIYLSPNLGKEERPNMVKPFAHALLEGREAFFGGYGYNYQYLGNARCPSADDRPFHAKATSILNPSGTLSIGDTKGARDGNPALPYGSGGPGAGNAYYEGGTDGSDAHRSTPSARNGGWVNLVYVDGHSEALKPEKLDGLGVNGSGTPHNGLWNGTGDPRLR